jgi:hypothetical protein
LINGGTPTPLNGTSQPQLPITMPIDVVNDLGTGTAWTVSINAEKFHTNALRAYPKTYDTMKAKTKEEKQDVT